MGCRSTEGITEEEAEDEKIKEEIIEEEARTVALSKEEEIIDISEP